MRQTLATVTAVVALSGALLPTAEAQSTTVSGTITYADKVYSTSGFTGSVVQRPVRYARVEVVDNATGLLTGAQASTTTDAQGAYSMAGVINNGNVYVRVTAAKGSFDMPTAGTAINAAVQNMSGATYAAISAVSPTPGGGPLTINLPITNPNVAPAFNIWDCVGFAFEWLRVWTLANGDAYPSPPTFLTVGWEPNNADGTHFHPDTNAIHLLGGPTDTDEYDDDIILHEFGHYVADEFAQADSLGGPHSLTGYYDIRLSYSEGWGHFLSASVRAWVQATSGVGPSVNEPANVPAGNNRWPDFRWQVDTIGAGASAWDIEGPSFPSQTIGASNEVAAGAILWDLVDTNNGDAGGVDTLPAAGAAPYGLVWRVEDLDIAANPWTSLERFFDGWMNRNASSAAAARNIFRARGVRYENLATTGGNTVPAGSSADTDDGGAGNNSVATAVNLAGLTYPVTRTALTYFPAADQDWYLFRATGGELYTVETLNLRDGCDTILEIRDVTGATVLASNDDRGAADVSSLIAWTAPASGSYAIRSVRFSGAPGRYGTYDLRISTTDATAPTVTINQATGQADPTNGSPINFTVVFSEWVLNFATGDVTLGGTAGATTEVVTGTGTTYNVAVSGMTGNGTVIVTIAAAVATDNAGNSNAASTSADNGVTYNAGGDTTAPAAPTPGVPAEAFTTTTPTPTLDWSDVTDPSGVTYEVQVDAEGTFASPLEWSVTGLGTSQTSSALLADLELHYWRVRAIDGAGNVGPWSPTRSFRVDRGRGFYVGLGNAGNDGWMVPFKDEISSCAPRALYQVPWAIYNGINGETRPATGDLDGDGLSEVVVGLGTFTRAGGWLVVLDDQVTGYAVQSWLRVPWSNYNAANGETWPSCGDIDGDGRDEIVVGLGTYRQAGGWLCVFDDAVAGHAVTAWFRVPRAAYNAADGETRPACGDLNGDGASEVVIGFARFPSEGGKFAIFDGATPTFLEFRTLDWTNYNSANGELWPACGDVDADGRDEICLGQGHYGTVGGWARYYDDRTTSYAPMAWLHVIWSAYDSAVGEVRPSIGNLDGDPGMETVFGFGPYPADGGKVALYQDSAALFALLRWQTVALPAYNAANGETRPSARR